MNKQIKITAAEKRAYVLRTKADIEILSLCRRAERMGLAKEDKVWVKLIKTQLRSDWRSPLIRKLDEILRRHKKNGKA